MTKASSEQSPVSPKDAKNGTPGGKLTTGPVGKHLFSMSWPMLFGVMSFIGFNLADTYFVAQLGSDQLSAISFTFPVSMFVFSMTIGLGIGLTSAVSRTVGSGDMATSRRLTTNGLLMGVFLVIAISAIGIITIEPLFRLLGAQPAQMPYIQGFMEIWYLGVVLIVVPMLGNAAIRAKGDARIPGLIMVTSAMLNVIIDPILIFGLLRAPALGIEGAAWASVIARAITMVIGLSVLIYRDRLITIAAMPLSDRLRDCGEILRIGLPATASQLIGPVSFGVATAMIAQYGAFAVGGFGIAGRIEGFAMIPIFALQAGSVPFIGQNMGAGLVDRARKAIFIGFGVCLIWGAVVAIGLYFGAVWIPSLFGVEPSVIATASTYLTIVPFSFIFYGLLLIATAGFNAMGTPIPALMLTALRMIVLFLPLAWLLSLYLDVNGIFIAAAIANVITGILGTVIILRRLNRQQRPSMQGV